VKRRPVNSRACPNPDCELQGKLGQGNITRHSFFKHKRGRRRRYHCGACGKTFSSRTQTQTPYHRLHHRVRTFDEVVAMSVDGASKSAIARTMA